MKPHTSSSPLTDRPTRSTRGSRTFRLLAALLLVSSAQAARLNERIAVSSTAAPTYVHARSAGDGLRTESYVFAEGEFMGGSSRDAQLASVTFDQIVHTLAPDLARQQYYPTKDVEGADLLIAVYWGASTIFDDPQKDQMLDALNRELPLMNSSIAENGIGDPGPLNHISESLAWAGENASQKMRLNAALLGYAKPLEKLTDFASFSPERGRTLRAELAEERYFIVLVAYDNQALRKDKVRRVRWITRLSVRSPGNRFVEALPALSHAGSYVYGRQVEDLVHMKANLREAIVSMGDLKLVEYRATPRPPPASQ